MLILMGERIRGRAEPSGQYDCLVCGTSRQFSRVTETNYFCLFGIPLVPIEKLSDYDRCDRCLTAYETNNHDLPSHVKPVREVLAYILLGYGMRHHPSLAEEIGLKLSEVEYPRETLQQLLTHYDRSERDVFEQLKNQARYMDASGKEKVVQAAFLVTHACCEIQYEDRLRINLIGNSLGVSLHFVDAAIARVRQASYFGVRRLVPTQSHIG